PDKQELIRQHIDYLTDKHEQLLLTYIDKVSIDLEYVESHLAQDPQDLMQLFLREMRETEKDEYEDMMDKYHLMRII
ncbi:aromatic acid exporter family protein, partial [Escherichia coli]|nr:aromatic acid exporter family protein [Escherichia coli]